MYGLPCPVSIARTSIAFRPSCERSSIPASRRRRGRARRGGARTGSHPGSRGSRRRRPPARAWQLALGRAVADDERRASVAQLSVEVGEALEQELRPRPGLVAPVEQPVVEAEDRRRPDRARRAPRAGRGGRAAGGRVGPRRCRRSRRWPRLQATRRQATQTAAPVPSRYSPSGAASRALPGLVVPLGLVLRRPSDVVGVDALSIAHLENVDRPAGGTPTRWRLRGRRRARS